MRLSGMDGFDSRFSVMDEEPGRISHIYSVTLSGDGIGDACYCSLQLKIKVQVVPGTKLPIFQLNDDIEVRVTDDYIRHANWESLDSSRESGNWGSSGCRSLDGVTTHPEIPLPNNISMAHQETPRRLYTSGMRLSPSPIKERLFPPSPSTSSGGSNLHSEVLHNMKRRIYVRRHSRTLDEELGQSLHGYQCDSEPDLNEVAPQQSDTRDLASHGSSPSRRSIVPRDRANWTEPLHQRDQSETTIIHWTPKDQYSPCGDQNSSPRGRSRVVIQFPRTSDITIPKREARSKIPIKSENIRHRDKLHDAIHVPVSPSKKIEVLSSILGERTNSENLRSIQDAHKFHIAGTKLPIATNRSEFSPMKWLRTPTIDTQEQKWNSEPGRNVGKNIQSTQTASTATQGRNRFISSIFEPIGSQKIKVRQDSKAPMARINSHSEADFFLDDTGRSSFVASWLHQNPQEDVGDITEKSKFTRFKLSIPGDQVDGANEGDSEILENRKGLESSLMSEHISLPSPTPSSKLSMPWNSAEELAGRSADASFFLDLETIGFKPIVSKEPRFEHINGILMMTFPCNAVREVVTYQARLEFRTDNPVFEAWDTETWAARWQFEYRPQWNDRLPRLSLGPILKSYGTGSLNRIYNFGRITLAMGTGDDIKGYTYEDCAGSDGLIDGRDLKVLLQQLATYRWLLSTFHKWRESLEQRVRKMSNSASALRLSAVRRHPTIVLLHYVLVLLLALLLMGGILFVLWKEGSAFGVALYQAGGYQSANRFWGASECRFSSHEAKMIEAGTASSPLKDSGVKAPELALSTSKSPMEATTNPIPRTSTILAPEETRSRERSHDNALRKSTGRLAMETRRFRLNPSHPNRPLLATAERSQGIYDEVSDLKMASKDDRIRDRIDRLLGWRRIYGR